MPLHACRAFFRVFELGMQELGFRWLCLCIGEPGLQFAHGISRLLTYYKDADFRVSHACLSGRFNGLLDLFVHVDRWLGPTDLQVTSANVQLPPVIMQLCLL